MSYSRVTKNFSHSIISFLKNLLSPVVRDNAEAIRDFSP